MNRYENFRTDDYVWDSFFRQWVLAPTSETNQFWEGWVKEDPERLRRVSTARNIVLNLQVAEPEISQERIDKQVGQTMAQLRNNHSDMVEPRTVNVHWKLWIKVAASILLVSGLIWGRRDWNTPVDKVSGQISIAPETTRNEIFNQSEIPQSYILSDGSKIRLQPGGSIKYLPGFADTHRTVQLMGTAFFEVERDVARPFIVETRDLVTKVLGTSFTVEAEEVSQEVRVSVWTGKVLVIGSKDPELEKKLAGSALNGQVLSPNQQILFSRIDSKMIKSLVREPVIILQEERSISFEFEETPASEVFATLAKAYGIDIRYDERLLRDCPLTATLDTQNLHDKLSIVCKAVEASYEIIDGQVVIHSKGCQ